MKNKIFLQTVSEAHKKDYVNSDQIGVFAIDGNELQRICEKYYSNKLNQSGLRHFYNGKKAEHIALGFSIAAILMTILFYFLIQPL